MQAIRIPLDSWGQVWFALVASGPISRISKDPIYLVSDEQVRMLEKENLPFEIVPIPARNVGHSRRKS
jgi:hypothetical protein